MFPFYANVWCGFLYLKNLLPTYKVTMGDYFIWVPNSEDGYNRGYIGAITFWGTTV